MIDPDQLTDAVRAKVETLQVELLGKVEANLSGGVLEERSGALKRSIVASIEARGDVLDAGVESIGIPYAAIQEYGGRTAPHEIVPVKAQALAFVGSGGIGFAKRVAHPGSILPARHYMAGALESLGPEIAGGLKQAVRDALGAA